MSTVLLVEDTLPLAQVVRRELEAAGLRVVHAADGAEALRLHARERPEVVVLDWMLPRMDGLTVLTQLRRTATTPVLMLTARSEEADRVIGLEVGADDYLTKPFGMRELVARVRALLRRAQVRAEVQASDQAAPAAPLTYGPLLLVPDEHRATLEGVELELTRTELALLHLLMRTPGRAFSRTYLLDSVWGDDSDSGDRAVDNTVMRLRRKLGALGSALETVWGVGYRLRNR